MRSLARHGCYVLRVFTLNQVLNFQVSYATCTTWQSTKNCTCTITGMAGKFCSKHGTVRVALE
eukprot:5204057-Amphidinium_carterae.2